MKKISAILLALILVLSMSSVAMAATITIDPKTPNGSSENVTYKAYKVFDATFVGETVNENTPVSYTIDSNSPFYAVIRDYKVGDAKVFQLDEINSTGVYNVTKLVSYDAADLAAKLEAVVTDNTPVAGTATKNEDTGKYEITGLKKGYYFVTSTLGSNIIVETLGTAEVDTKNAYPSLTKKIVSGDTIVDTITADRGAIVTFEITVTIPADATGSITVHDVLDSNMTIGDVVTADPVIATKNATADTGCTADFTISETVVNANKGKSVSFQYTATVNGTAPTANVMKNTAWLTYNGFTSVEDEVTVYTYQIDVFKYKQSGNDKVGLAGAGFVLKNAEGKYYSVAANGNVAWVDTEAAATELTTTDAVTTVSFVGLANGTYTLIEKTVPAGYNKANDVTLTINNANVSTEVLNSTGSKLPSTGGMGTTIFYVVGGLLMAAAVVLLVTKKKVSAR